MRPRLQNSKQWTPFPPEYLDNIQEVLNENFEDELVEAEFRVEGRIYPNEILMRVGFCRSGELRQMNLEASITFDPAKQPAKDVIGLGLDALGAIFTDYFEEDEDLDLPIHWKGIEFEGEEIFIQYSTVNTQLEEEANRLLGSSVDSLVKDEELSEDAMDQASVDNELASAVQKLIREGKYPKKH